MIVVWYTVAFSVYSDSSIEIFLARQIEFFDTVTTRIIYSNVFALNVFKQNTTLPDAFPP